MKIVGTERIKDEGGDYLILNDNGTEGLSVHGQYHSVEEAIYALAAGTYSNNTLVKIVDLKLEIV